MTGDYYKTEKGVEEYIKAAEGYNGSGLIEKLKNYLFPNSHLLEIGTGPGSDWEILNEGFEVTGSDNSQPFLNKLRKKFPNADFIDLDAVTLSTNKTFDAIYSNKVLHHLNDKELNFSIKRQYDLLNPKGIICHSFWKGEGSEIFKGLFVNYHTILNIRNIFSKYFDILLIEKYKEFDDDDSIVLIAKRKEKIESEL